MKTREWNFFRNCVRYIITAVAALPLILLAASGAWACIEIPHQHIEGNPIDITCYHDGQMELYFQDVQEYEDYFPGCSWGSVLMFDNGEKTLRYGDSYHASCSSGQVKAFTPWSNTKPNDWEIDTVLKAYEARVFVTQKVEYINGSGYYKMTWIISNQSSSTYTNCKFFHGGNATFGGFENAASYWNANLGMVYLKNPEIGGYMGFYGGQDSMADRYYGGDFIQGLWQVFSGNLPNTVDPSFETDAGYYLQWNKETLEPGETWTITAYEKWITWTGDLGVEVIAPEGEPSATKGDTIDLSFTIWNHQSTTDTFDLQAESDLGWPVSFPYNEDGSVTIEPGQSATVIVRVELPDGADDSIDLITLTATSRSDLELTGSDSVDLAGEGKSITPDDEDTDGYRTRHHNDYCFVSTAEDSSDSGIMLVLALVFLSLGIIVRRRTAEVPIEKKK